MSSALPLPEVRCHCHGPVAWRLRCALAEAFTGVTEGQMNVIEQVLVTMVGATRLRVPMANAAPSLAPFVAVASAVHDALAKLESPIEADFYGLLAGAGLALDFEPQRVIPVRLVASNGMRQISTRADFAHRWLPIAVYCDGEGHAERFRRERDDELTEALWSQGWRVLRFTGRLIRAQPATVIARVRAALDLTPSRRAA